MNKTTAQRPIGPRRKQPAGVSPEQFRLNAVITAASKMMEAGNFLEAINLLLSESELVMREPVACNTLAYLLLQAERPKDALTWFEVALERKPEDLQAVMGAGHAHEALGAREIAVKWYEQATRLNPQNAEFWFKHGAALAELGRGVTGLPSIEKALELDPAHVGALGKRRDIIDAMGNLSGAIEAAIACCRAAPKQAHPLRRLGDLLQRNGNMDKSLSAYDMALKLSPGDFHALYNKAMALKKIKREAEALGLAQQALRIKPDHKDTLMLCGNLEYALGNMVAASACYKLIASRGVVRSYPAKKKPAAFRALLLFSPVSGNTPYEDLIKDSQGDFVLRIMIPDYRYDPAEINAEAEIVVNLVSDADLGSVVISSVAELTDQLNVPIINPPRVMLGTDRQSIARRLADISDAIMPITVRMLAADVREKLASGEIHFPSIIRYAGTHGGDRMEKVETEAELLGFLDDAGEHPLYMTDYVEYGSPDGLYRKYRFIFVGEQTLPYHLAIGEQWKVHHASTKMRDVEWMRDEEAAFLNDPSRYFSDKALAALDAIRREIGLDYFGIDCSLDADGRVVIFEVNASMLIHLGNEGFEYKNPHVNRIQAAFSNLLERRVMEVRGRAIAAE